MIADADLLAIQVLGNGVSVFQCYENRDGDLEKPEWYAIDKPMGFDYGHCGNCGVGNNPVAAIKDLLRIQKAKIDSSN